MVQTPVFWSDTFQVNPTSAASEGNVDTITLANGNVLVSYQSGSNYFARVLDSTGNALGSEFQITPTSSATYSTVSMDADISGGFWRLAKVVSGGGGAANRPQLTGESFELQKFTEAGVAQGNAISIALKNIGATVDDVRVAVGNGTGMVVWTETVGGNEDTLYRTFDTATGALGAVTTLPFSDTVYAIDVQAIGDFFHIGIVRNQPGAGTADAAFELATINSFGAGTNNSVLTLDTFSADGVTMGLREGSNPGQATGTIVIERSGIDHRLNVADNVVTGFGNNGQAVYDGEIVETLFIPGTSAQDLDFLASVVWSATTVTAHVYVPNLTPVGSISVSTNGAPTSASATALDDGRIQLVWTDASGEVQSQIVDARAAPNDTAGPSGRIVGTIFNDTITGTGGDDELIGGKGDDTLTGNAGNDIITGGDGVDDIKGNGGNDIIRGGDGGDTLEGGGGVDTIFAGEGVDTVRGGASGDTLYGGSGDDTMRGNSGNDVIYGEGDDDNLSGDGGRDVLFGGAGIDTLRGNNGWDRLFGDADNDLLIGGDGNDILLGGTGNDELRGNVGKDILRGEGGNDTLSGGGWEDFLDGGTGDDNLWGGSGRDFFYFSAGYGEDTIKDWEDNLDEIRLDDALWTGVLSAQDVVDNYGTVLSGNAVLSFDNGESLIVEGVTNLQTLVDDITIV